MGDGRRRRQPGLAERAQRATHRRQHGLEIQGIDEAGAGVRTKDLFLVEGDDPAAPLAATGFLPSFMPDLMEAGPLRLDTFYR